MPEGADNKTRDAAALADEALSLHQRGDLRRAEARYRDALRLAPDDPDLLHRLGLLLLHAHRPLEAIPLVRQALASDESAAQTWLLLGMAELAAAHPEAAQDACARALALQPDNPAALNLAARLAQQRGDAAAAREFLEHALLLRPDFGDAQHNMGITLANLGETEAALRHYARALALAPGKAQIHCNRGLLLLQAGRIAEANDAFDAALALNDRHLPARLEHVYCKLLLCDWDGLDEALDRLQKGLRARLAQPGANAVSPYILNLAVLPADLIRDVTRRYAAGVSEQAAKTITVQPRGKRDAGPLRIAYLSQDFGAHAVGGLVYQLFREHDRKRFQISAFSLRHFDDWFAEQIRAGCDDFHDLSALSRQAAADTIAAAKPDILIDLGGYTAGARPELLAARLAPLQLSWLGYLNSSGAGFIDYLVADREVIPPDQESPFSEAIARLPGTFLPASPLPVAEHRPARAELGLPDDACVFCSFNNPYKIQRDTFDAWMRILDKTPGSVLWLYAGGEARTRENLRRYAREYAVDPARLVFADGLPMDAHMARMPCADLFLDSFHYNAGATAVGALRAGVPLLTLEGERMLGRMGASLNRAAGLAELVCQSPEQYVEKALALAAQPGELAALRQRLAAVLARDEVFNVGHFVARLETMLEQIWAQQAAGLKPASFDA